MDDQDSFVKSCEAAERYPENVVRHNTYMHNLKAYREMLNMRAPLLFCPEEMTCLDVWEYYDTNSGLSTPRDPPGRQTAWADFQGRIRFDDYL